MSRDNLTKIGQDVYTENYKTLLRENVEIPNRWMNQEGDQYFLRCQFSPNWSKDGISFQSQSQQAFPCRDWQTDSKICVEMQRPQCMVWHTATCRPHLAHCVSLEIVLFNTATLMYLCIVYGCFHTKMAESSTCDRDHLFCKT